MLVHKLLPFGFLYRFKLEVRAKQSHPVLP